LLGNTVSAFGRRAGVHFCAGKRASLKCQWRNAVEMMEWHVSGVSFWKVQTYSGHCMQFFETDHSMPSSVMP
jgi:hypothetical protein